METGPEAGNKGSELKPKLFLSPKGPQEIVADEVQGRLKFQAGLEGVHISTHQIFWEKI